MGRMVRKGCLQEVGLELCFGECRGWMEWITSVNVWNLEKTWFVRGWGAVEQTEMLAGLSSISIFGGWDKLGPSKLPK